MTKRLRIGVIGTGIIARVMHLHYLDELAESFEVAAVCDIVPENAKACAERYGIAATYTDWRELIQQPMDAVLVLTSGSHAPIAVEAARPACTCWSRSRCASRWPKGRRWWRLRKRQA